MNQVDKKHCKVQREEERQKWQGLLMKNMTRSEILVYSNVEKKCCILKDGNTTTGNEM